MVSYHAPNGFYSSSSGYFNGAVSKYPLTALASGSTAHGNGVYAYGSTSVFPTTSYNATNYWVDPAFTTSAPAAAVANGPSTATSSLAANVNGASPDDTDTTPQITNKIVGNVQPVMVSFPAAAQPQSLRIQVTTTVAAEGSESPAHTVVPGSVVYDPSTHSAVFHPQSPLVPGAVYNAVARWQNAAGATMAPITWSFTVASSTSPASPARAPLGGRMLAAGPLVSEIEERSAR